MTPAPHPLEPSTTLPYIHCPHCGMLIIGVVKSDKSIDVQEHDNKIREEVMDKFGILHGEDAKRFHEYMEREDKIETPEGKSLIKQAWELANKQSRDSDVLDDVDNIASQLSINKQLITFVQKVTNTLRRRELRTKEREQG